jgi:branched-chain amino acid transport system ATP-binding protein
MNLEIKNLTVYYGKAQALDDVSISVPSGTVVSIVGANGSGKSTILRAISGLVPVGAGEIWYDDRRIDGLKPLDVVKLGIVHVPEGRLLFPNLSVLVNLQMGATLRRDKEGIARDLKAVFERFPVLERRRGQKAGTLSGGEQEMLAIARGLMARPRLLLMDEPSLGLAPKVVAEVGEVIKEINQTGVSVLLVEQNVPLALGVAKTGYAMQVGRVVVGGDIEQIRASDIVRKAFLG